jgi:hypothetical protein
MQAKSSPSAPPPSRLIGYFFVAAMAALVAVGVGIGRMTAVGRHRSVGEALSPEPAAAGEGAVGAATDRPAAFDGLRGGAFADQGTLSTPADLGRRDRRRAEPPSEPERSPAPSLQPEAAPLSAAQTEGLLGRLKDQARAKHAVTVDEIEPGMRAIRQLSAQLSPDEIIRRESEFSHEMVQLSREFSRSGPLDDNQTGANP